VSRLGHLAVWLLGAIVAAVSSWYVMVYLLDDWNRGYGRTTWYQLRLYVSAIAAGAGLVGYGIAGAFRPRVGTLGTAILAGIAFGICDLLVVFALEQIFPERETVVQRLVVALVLGAASILISRGQRS
jgi:hypothetical protein